MRTDPEEELAGPLVHVDADLHEDPAQGDQVDPMLENTSKCRGNDNGLLGARELLVGLFKFAAFFVFQGSFPFHPRISP